ncbi:hypothetical protein GOBAR_AA08734 [Gossypium barbadense]|uniref:Uncharacterized protein n=1 Tax=Gossypium barbadense TaxID=3634 RepID=A0A2P5Y8J3_GOSBA|nr:hypothetical protein GOBAR_AA08734 [Gossypium barbadense]
MHIRVCNEATEEQFSLRFYVANQKWYKQYNVLKIQDPLEKGNFSVVLENGPELCDGLLISDRLLKSTWNCLLPSSGSLTSTTNCQPSQWIDMSFRGRGRGRGRGFGGRGFGGYVPPEPFVLFPDIELPDVKAVPEEKTLVVWNSRLLNYWKASPYYLEEHVSKKSQSMDIERFSDWGKPKNTSKRDSLNQVLQLQSHNFPKELIGDSKRAQRSAKRMRWNLDSGLEKLDMFEKFEKMNLYISCSSIGMVDFLKFTQSRQGACW